MLLLIGFAFLAGIVTVLSPCILPVLPVVLSGTVGGGKARPWGIITGFIASFTVFTLALSSLVQALGFSPDLLRWVSAGLILAFGVVMAVPVLKDWFTGWATFLVSRSPAAVRPGKKVRGFWGGTVLGFGLGLVWTPCVGPIMASVITLALTRSVDGGSVVITLAYTLGTAVPLFLIMKGGRTLLNRFSWFTRHSPGIQRGFGVLMVVTALALFTGADRTFSSWLLTTFPSYGSGLTAIEDQPGVRAELATRRTQVGAPQTGTPDPFTLAKGVWINSPPLTLGGLKGKVVLVDFWTYSCINCVRTLPYLRAWYEKYKDKGLMIVGVHSPEFAFEQSELNVRQAVKDLKVTWPVVQDNGYGVWNAFQNQYWPAHYLYNRDGTLVDSHFGEGSYAETEAAIVRALGVGSTVEGPVADAVPVTDGDLTPETYLGYGRGSRFASPEKVAADVPMVYTVPKIMKTDHWAFGGPWTVGKESSSASPGSSLVLRFRGGRVYLVMGTPDGVVRPMSVAINGKPLSPVLVGAERMYQVFEGAREDSGVLTLGFAGPVKVYALTFG